MYGPVQIAGYVVLLLMPTALLGRAIFGLPELPTGAIGFEVGIVLTGTIAAAAERKYAFDGLVDAPGFDEADAIDAAAVVTGAVLSHGLHVSAGFGPVLGSALVGVLVGLSLPRVSTPMYCGSFVGMASPTVFPSPEFVVAAGLVAGLVYVATAESFAGIGGKLGTIALSGCAATVALAGLEYGTVTEPRLNLISVVVPVAIASAVATAVLSIDFELGTVVGSGLTGVVAGIMFPLLSPELGTTLATVTFCASFVGMSSADRLATIAHVGVAGAFCGLVYLTVTPAFSGAGGKLGTVAFVSCLGLVGAVELRDAAFSRLG